MRGSPVSKTPQKTAPPQMLRLPRIFLSFNIARGAQWLPSERFHLLSLQKTRSESPGPAPPQNFPIAHLPRNAVTPQFLVNKLEFSGDRPIIAHDFDAQKRSAQIWIFSSGGARGGKYATNSPGPKSAFFKGDFKKA